MKHIWVECFYLGVREGDTSWIWGYAEGYNFDLEVRKYQIVENPCRGCTTTFLQSAFQVKLGAKSTLNLNGLSNEFCNELTNELPHE